MGKEYRAVKELQYHLDEPGSELVGKLVNREASVLGVNFYHIIPEGESKSVGLLGSVGLDEQMTNVKDGDDVKIILNDTIPTRGGTRFKDYTVFVLEEE